jgi:hypothetical protein
MDLTEHLLDEIALEGLDGLTIQGVGPEII